MAQELSGDHQQHLAPPRICPVTVAAITVHTDATHSSGYEEIDAISVTGYPGE